MPLVRDVTRTGRLPARHGRESVGVFDGAVSALADVELGEFRGVVAGWGGRGLVAVVGGGWEGRGLVAVAAVGAVAAAAAGGAAAGAAGEAVAAAGHAAAETADCAPEEGEDDEGAKDNAGYCGPSEGGGGSDMAGDED